MTSLRHQFHIFRWRLREAVRRWFERGPQRRRARLTRRLIAEGGTDTARWSAPASFEDYWVERNRLLASRVPPGAAVLEFGAGLRELEKLLPPGCRYTPSDLVDRGPGTIICDLNARPLPGFPPHDVVVLSGVLEYLHAPAEVLARLREAAPVMLLSYAVWDGASATLESRRGNGFVNDLADEKLDALLAGTGWVAEPIGAWHGQRLLRCRRSDGVGQV
jgi:hypothetical protein